MEPLQNGCRNKNVTGHKAPMQRLEVLVLGVCGGPGWRGVGEVQTLAMLMNAPCSLIMSHAERLFLLAIFLMRYRWKCGCGAVVSLQRTAKLWGWRKKHLNKKNGPKMKQKKGSLLPGI